MGQKIGFKTWRAALEVFMVRDWRLTVADAGVDDEQLRLAFEQGWSAREFSTWWGEKYDLTHASEVRLHFGR